MNAIQMILSLQIPKKYFKISLFLLTYLKKVISIAAIVFKDAEELELHAAADKLQRREDISLKYKY